MTGLQRPGHDRLGSYTPARPAALDKAMPVRDATWVSCRGSTPASTHHCLRSGGACPDGPTERAAWHPRAVSARAVGDRSACYGNLHALAPCRPASGGAPRLGETPAQEWERLLAVGGAAWFFFLRPWRPTSPAQPLRTAQQDAIGVQQKGRRPLLRSTALPLLHRMVLLNLLLFTVFIVLPPQRY